MFDVAMIESAVMIALRGLWPFIGGAAVFSEGDLQKIAGGLVAVGWVVYHGVRRYRGRRSDAPTIKF